MSKSTDKLEVVTRMVNNFPPDKMAKIKTIEIVWGTVGAGDMGEEYVAVPTVKLEFFP